MTVRVVLADDHAAVRRVLRQIIEEGSACTVCAEAADGSEALRLAQELTPDVAVLDINMPKMDGMEVARRIRACSPATAVLMISMHRTEQAVRLAVAVGARGYILKEEAAEHLAAAVLAVARSDQPYFTTLLTPAMWAQHGLGQRQI